MQPGDWYTFNADLAATRYARANEVTPANAAALEKVWEYRSGDVSEGKGDVPKTVWSATPLFVNDTLYLGTPFYRILALEPDTGRLKWSHDTHSRLEPLTQSALKNRGVAYWESTTDAGARTGTDSPVRPRPSDDGTPVGQRRAERRVYIGTMDAKVHAVDADTGDPCADFGENGILDVNRWNAADAPWPLSVLQPPTVYRDTLFIGWAGKDWEATVEPPGSVFAVDARSGVLKWTFEPIPPEARGSTGTANVWASMSVDAERGLVYLPVSSPSPNFFGGARQEALPYVTSLTALDADSGEVVWSRQLVHHDLWDYDTNAPPTLVDLERDGRTVPALVQTSKQGFLYVLDRTTGEPVFPIEERAVPASDVPGEVASPTQPFVDVPEPTNAARWPGLYWLADLIACGGCRRRAARTREEGRFTPPSTGGEGTLVYPPTSGGMQWGGGALDPATGRYYVNSSNIVQLYRLIPREEYERVASGSGEEQGYYPQSGSPYGFRLTNFLNWLGMPCWKPPYGELSAYDLNDGRLLWRRPFGRVRRYGLDMPKSWGSPTIGGPVVTAGGVLFIGASIDARVRAIDPLSGAELWSARVAAPAVAIPSVYTYRGRQYVVFVAGGNPILTPAVSDQVVAFALPRDGIETSAGRASQGEG